MNFKKGRIKKDGWTEQNRTETDKERKNVERKIKWREGKKKGKKC